jgi:hypothetical protein
MLHLLYKNYVYVIVFLLTKLRETKKKLFHLSRNFDSKTEIILHQTELFLPYVYLFSALIG